MKEKIKFYNSKMYETEKKIKTAFIILITFLTGMYIGLAINYLELQNKEEKIREYQVEIDSLRETIYILQGEDMKNE